MDNCGERVMFYKGLLQRPLYKGRSEDASSVSSYMNTSSTNSDSSEVDGSSSSKGNSSYMSTSSTNSDSSEVDGSSSRGSDPAEEGYGDARVTMVEALNFLLQFKKKHRIGKIPFNELLHFMKNHLLPQNNILPDSTYLMKKVIGCQDWSTFEEHICDCDKGE